MRRLVILGMKRSRRLRLQFDGFCQHRLLSALSMQLDCKRSPHEENCFTPIAESSLSIAHIHSYDSAYEIIINSSRPQNMAKCFARSTKWCERSDCARLKTQIQIR